MLNKAEANLLEVNRLSEEVIAQKEELNRKANMELEAVKANVTIFNILNPLCKSSLKTFMTISLILTSTARECRGRNRVSPSATGR